MNPFNFIKSRIVNVQLINYRTTSNQLYHLMIDYRFCLKIYINDKRVPKRKVYIVGEYENSKMIKIKIIGLFNNCTEFVEISPKSLDVVSFNLNKVNKTKSSVLNTISLKYTLAHDHKLKSKSLSVFRTLKLYSKKEFIDKKNSNLNLSITNKDYNLTQIKNLES